MNKVSFLLTHSFKELTVEKQLRLVELGPDRPRLTISQHLSSGFNCKFNYSWYNQIPWLTGCANRNSLFCFCCLLFGGEDEWSVSGVAEIRHLTEKTKDHEKSKIHINNAMDLALFGKAEIGVQLGNADQQVPKRHNEDVDRNRYVLSKLIDCIKVSSRLYHQSKHHDETENSINVSVYKELVKNTAESDAIFQYHYENGSIFKRPKKLHDELLECMFQICLKKIKEEIQFSKFLAIQVDETTDFSSRPQLAITFRYVLPCGTPVERFYGFCNPSDSNAATLTEIISQKIKEVLTTNTTKLIAQSYDGAAVMNRSLKGISELIQYHYPNAHYVHCHSHRLNLLMLQSASCIPEIRLFFLMLKGFSDFFHNSPHRILHLDAVLDKNGIPSGSDNRWKFDIKLVQVVYENQNTILECLETIQVYPEMNSATIKEAIGLSSHLQNGTFLFWLSHFYNIMPDVDTLEALMQSQDDDPSQLNNYINVFKSAIERIRMKIDCSETNPDFPEPPRKKMSPANKHAIATEVCDIISVQACDRLSYIGHLQASQLFVSNKFLHYKDNFPQKVFDATVIFYPFLNGERLKAELQIIYERKEFYTMQTMLQLLKFLIQNSLAYIYSECVALLDILITTPTSPVESDSTCSTLEKIQNFAGSRTREESLSALAMMCIETEFISKLPDFNNKVVDKFAQLTHRTNFLLRNH